MNALVVLLMATSPAADPVAQAPVTSAPTYTYTVPGSATTTEESRPRLFSRIRKLFRRNSQPSDVYPATSYPAPSSGVAGSNVWGTMPPGGSSSPQVVGSGSTTAPVLTPVPTTTTPDTGAARKLPTGNPF